MTIYHSDDFEGHADFAIPPGWQAPGGGTSNWMVRDVNWLAANGTKSLTSPGSSPGTPVEFVLVADKTKVRYEFRQKAAIDGSNQYIASVAHCDHLIGNPTDFNYRFLITATTSSVTANISPFIGGNYPGNLGTGTRSMPTAANDIIGVLVEVDDKKCSIWVWNTSIEAMPVNPLATWTDSVQRPAGHFGAYWPGTVLVGIDQLVITDIPSGSSTTHDVAITEAVTSASAADSTVTTPNSASVTEAATASVSTDAILVPANNGTLTIPPFHELTTGVLRAGETGVTVIINNATTGALVVKKTGMTTHATTGECVVNDVLLIAGNEYRATTILSDGSEGTWRYIAT